MWLGKVNYVSTISQNKLPYDSTLLQSTHKFVNAYKCQIVPQCRCTHILSNSSLISENTMSYWRKFQFLKQLVFKSFSQNFFFKKRKKKKTWNVEATPEFNSD